VLYPKIASSKTSLLKGEKIMELLEEQHKIFNNLPDGAIIHKSRFK
jgi:hypothetical protein